MAMEAEEAGGGVMKGGAHERMGVGGGGEAGRLEQGLEEGDLGDGDLGDGGGLNEGQSSVADKSPLGKRHSH